MKTIPQQITEEMLRSRAEMKKHEMGSEGWWEAFNKLRRIENTKTP